MRVGPWEFIMIAGVALLFFGPKRLTDLGPALGKSIRGFKKSMAEDDEPPANNDAKVASVEVSARRS